MPPEIVDVAVVDVALKFPNVGVEVAVMTPDEFVERRELIDVPDSVRDGVENDEVAIKFAAVTVPPSKYAEPTTESLYPGVVDPIPTFPFAKTLNMFVPVDDATANTSAIVPYVPFTVRVVWLLVLSAF